jgi:pimeloyl-ACP methyl ester carboxylesterase
MAWPTRSVRDWVPALAGRDTAAAIPGARLVILPGVGHDLPAEVWPEIAAEMRALADR